MKRFFKHLLLLTTSAFVLTGCFLKSVHPLVLESEALLLEGLEGQWEGSEQRWTFIVDLDDLPDFNISGPNFEGTVGFESDEGDSFEPYYLVIVEDLESAETDSTFLLGLVGEIEGRNFLDLTLLDNTYGNNGYEQAHLFPVHTFSRITFEESSLSIEFFKDSWIKDLIENNQVRIKHEKVDDQILITASSNELKKFVEKYSGDTEAFDDPVFLNPVLNEL